jgi:ATP-dependent Zn protease
VEGHGPVSDQACIFKNTNISSGASQDIQQVKTIAEQMIVHLGMGDKIIISDPSKINDEIDKLDHEYSKTNTLKYSSFD